MKITILLVLTTLISAPCIAQSHQSASSIDLQSPGLEARVDALVKAYMDLDIFSGVVLIADAGAPVYHKAFGLANRERGIANTLNSKFAIGSMNKTYTQVVILQLIAEGKLRYSDKLVNILDRFVLGGTDHITVEHLLNHTSGFGDYHGPEFWQLEYADKNIAGITEILKGMPLMFPPGEEHEYSNAGYILLGAIIEKTTGQSYAQNVRQRIIQPLGLTNTYVENKASIPDMSIGYSRTINGIQDNLDLVFEPKSDGGFWATASDVMAFYRSFFYDETLVKKSAKESFEFFQHIRPAYDDPGTGIPIAGGMNGSNTIHLEMLHDNISIVVLANMDEPVAEKLCLGIHAILNGKDPQPPALPAVLNVYEAYLDNDVEYIRKNFESLTTNFHPTDPKDLILNNLGYELLFSDQTDRAIEIFKLNTELFPQVGNCWDSYGEALLAKGDRAGALKAYRKALEINPNIPSAQEAVKKLQ
jgi:CubicO group peptidase (beta-lactamase class C family)